MTTKYKIITGFGLLMALVAALVFLGYSTAQRSSEDFEEYRRMARLNVGMSDVILNLNGAFSELYAFMRSRNDKDMEQSQKYSAALLKTLQDADPFTRSESTKALFKELIQDTNTFMDMQRQLHENVRGISSQYSDVVMPSALACMESLAELSQMARELGNADALGQAAIVWHKLVLSMSSMSRFANTISEKDAETVRNYFKELAEESERMEAMLFSEAGRRTFASFMVAEAKLQEALAHMHEQSLNVRKNLNTIDAFMATVNEKTAAYNIDINNRMTARGSTTLDENDNTRRIVLVTGLVGLIAGTAIALFIVIGIIRVLKDLSGYAMAVARGDFGYQLKVREKGEIGGMVEAMQAIPAVLAKIIQTADRLAGAIRIGKMRERINLTELDGEYARLGSAVNTVSEAYTDMLDAIPLPVMACDKSYSVVYLNRVGQDVTGGNHLETQCKGCLNAAECATDKCFGRQAMEKLAPVSGETTVFPNGKRMEVAITAIPLKDTDGTAAGYFEVMADLTSIKEQQATMMQVAKQATEISDRVAAASEELAAQVEQISRGAEIQRDRVTSTASAMAEMNATVLEVARSAGEASSKSDDTRSKADNGAQLVNQVVESINTVNNVATGLQNNMQELGVQAEGIGGVMNVISDIADQTNLLALNAAIEAARAGEAGRGFAVVADEVRKLAEKTMEATREVGDNITAIQHSARLNMDEVEKAVDSVGTATRLADESGLALQEIVSIASDNSQVVASIATAAEEQSATSEEINQSVDEINRVVGETTEGMVQSSAAVQELSRMAQELKRVMEGLR